MKPKELCIDAAYALGKHCEKLQYRIDLLHKFQFQIEELSELRKFRPTDLDAYVWIKNEKEVLLEELDFLEKLFK